MSSEWPDASTIRTADAEPEPNADWPDEDGANPNANVGLRGDYGVSGGDAEGAPSPPPDTGTSGDEPRSVRP